MKGLKTLCIAAICAIFLSSCAVSKKSPLVGVIYTKTKSPVAVTNHSGATKVGTAEAMSVLGIFASGDASIDAAAKSAGISKIHHVDEECFGVLGIFATYKVYVYGD